MQDTLVTIQMYPWPPKTKLVFISNNFSKSINDFTIIVYVIDFITIKQISLSTVFVKFKS